MAAFAKFGTKKRESYLQLLREGNHRSSAARGVGVSPELVRLYRKANPPFAADEEGAEAEACGVVEDSLFKAAKSGNVTACQVWLYNRCPERWQDRRNVVNEHTFPGGVPLSPADVEAGKKLAEQYRQQRAAHAQHQPAAG